MVLTSEALVAGRFWRNTQVWQTDRQTPADDKYRAYA